MCGIAGVVGSLDMRAAADAVHRMSAVVARRGPDDEGLETWDGAVLGHRRLAIFDLSSAGHQPMLSPDGESAVVFNGSIYNFLGLRAELEARDCHFRSKSDTEVLLHGYREWGIDTLVRKLRGMFAFGLWDNRISKLFLVRDRLGVKPLLFSLRPESIAFASSVRALRAAGFGEEIDPQAVVDYLEFGYVPDNRTIAKGVSKLPAATILEYSSGQVVQREYWSPPPIDDNGRRMSFDDAVEETERLFMQAVRRRLYADVPVGTLLSGGVDSGLICWAVKELGGDITAFTVSTPGDPVDESEDAIHTARRLEIPHRVLRVSPEHCATVEELVSAYGEPFACPSALGMLNVSRVVRESASVLLTGDGGDDVFLGYPEHRHLLMSQQLANLLPPFAPRGWRVARKMFPRVGLIRRGVHFLDYASGGLGAVTNAYEGLPEYRSDGLLGERVRAATIEQRCIPWSRSSARQLLSDFLVYDRKTRFVGEYMTKVDGATMHYGLEARSPFLDQDLWEFSATLPYSVRLRRWRLKAVLRELARRHLGEHVARGKKRGFVIPVQRWIAGGWSDDVEAHFRNSELVQNGWIQGEAVNRCLDQARKSGRAPMRLWYLYVLERWFKHEAANRVHALGEPCEIPALDTGRN